MHKNIIKFVAFFVLFYPLLFTSTAEAGFYDWLASKSDQSISVAFNGQEALENSASFDKMFSWGGRRPENTNLMKGFIEEPKEEPKPEIKVIKTYIVRATGYSSTPDQTDDTPCIAASGYNVCTGDKNVIAANFSMNGKRPPFGTLVRIPEIYGDKVFVVEDRMNARYTNNIDIWFPERNLAKVFGSKIVTIEIIQELGES